MAFHPECFGVPVAERLSDAFGRDLAPPVLTARPMPTALLLSPHLDDAAFSCGATSAALAAAGWDVAMATLFTASVPNPTGFALECQTSKGLAADIDYMQLRRAEDAAAAVALGCSRVEWLPLPEAPHRGYESATELFEPPHDDDSPDELIAAIDGLLARHRPDVVFAPQAWGRHVDHVLTVRAVSWLQPQHIAWYFDTPYVLRDDPTPPPDEFGPLFDGCDTVTVTLPSTDAWDACVAAKLDACAAYASQLGFQFGSVEAMRATLGEAAERLMLPPAAVDILSGPLTLRSS